MIKQAISFEKVPNVCDQAQTGRNLEHHQEHALDDIRAILIDTAVQVGALIDGTFVDPRKKMRRRSFSPPATLTHNFDRKGEEETLYLALTKSNRGLHTGGYIELHLLSEKRVIKANGGYYDAWRHPRPVCEKSLSLHELDHQKLGQILVMIHNRVLREYAECAAMKRTRNALSATL